MEAWLKEDDSKGDREAVEDLKRQINKEKLLLEQAETNTAQYASQAAYYAAMEQKYRTAAERPWLAEPPDPAIPPGVIVIRP